MKSERFDQQTVQTDNNGFGYPGVGQYFQQRQKGGAI